MKALFSKKSANLIKQLVIFEFKLRDQGTIFGFFWTLLHPLLMFAVLYTVFIRWMSAYVDNFPAYLLVGIVQWNFFAGATTNTMGILYKKRNLVNSINFPKEILVIASVFTIFISYLLELAVLFVFLSIIGVHFSPLALFLIPIISIQLILVLGLSLILATFYVYYRDIGRIWGILVQIGFFLTPIFYPLSLVEPFKRQLIEFNPMTQIINSSRGCLLYGQLPPFLNLFWVLLSSLFVLFCGYRLFKKKEAMFAEIL